MCVCVQIFVVSPFSFFIHARLFYFSFLFRIDKNQLSSLWTKSKTKWIIIDPYYLLSPSIWTHNLMPQNASKSTQRKDKTECTLCNLITNQQKKTVEDLKVNVLVCVCVMHLHAYEWKRFIFDRIKSCVSFLYFTFI